MAEQGSKKDIYVGLARIGTLSLMVMPLSPGMLDLFLTLSIVSAVFVFFLTVNVRNPMEFSMFPTVLLITTLFRPRSAGLTEITRGNHARAQKAAKLDTSTDERDLGSLKALAEVRYARHLYHSPPSHAWPRSTSSNSYKRRRWTL